MATTAETLLHLPDDGYRYELVGGQLVRDSPAGGEHGLIAFRLGRLLGNWAHERQAGVVLAAETGFKLRTDPDTVRAPDVSFVSHERVPGEGVPRGFWEGAPDLAVEVLSPEDRMVDVLAKVRDYLEAGVRQVWIVAPQSHTVAIYRSLRDVRVLAEDDVLAGEDPVDGFRCSLQELFSRGSPPSRGQEPGSRWNPGAETIP